MSPLKKISVHYVCSGFVIGHLIKMFMYVSCYWRASETLSGVYKFELERYVYININTIADFHSHRKCIAQK